jgi:hypothetical protein
MNLGIAAAPGARSSEFEQYPYPKTRNSLLCISATARLAIVTVAMLGHRIIVPERSYSGKRDGQVMVSDSAVAKKRPLELRSVLFKHRAKGFTRSGDSSGCRGNCSYNTRRCPGDGVRAMETHEYFSRRGVVQFSKGWTISRGRLIAYVGMVEHEKRTGGVL